MPGIGREKNAPLSLGDLRDFFSSLKLAFILQSLQRFKKKKIQKKKGGLLGDIPVAGSETDVHQRWERNFSGANAGHKPGSHQEANSAGKGICKGAWYQQFPKQGVMLHPWLGFTGQKLWGNAGSNPGVGTEMGGLGRLRVEWS